MIHECPHLHDAFPSSPLPVVLAWGRLDLSRSELAPNSSKPLPFGAADPFGPAAPPRYSLLILLGYFRASAFPRSAISGWGRSGATPHRTASARPGRSRHRSRRGRHSSHGSIAEASARSTVPASRSANQTVPSSCRRKRTTFLHVWTLLSSLQFSQSSRASAAREQVVRRPPAPAQAVVDGA